MRFPARGCNVRRLDHLNLLAADVVQLQKFFEDGLGMRTTELIQLNSGEVAGVFHCFTGNAALAGAALRLGFYISAAGIVTFPKASELRDTLKTVPLDRLLTETDSPFLAPVPYRGKRNEPAHVVRVVETLAALHGVATEAMAAQTAANFRTLFGP